MIFLLCYISAGLALYVKIMMMKKPFSILITRPSGRPFNISFSYVMFRLMFIVPIVLFLILLCSLYFNATLLSHYNQSKYDVIHSGEQSEVLETLNDEVQSLRSLIEDLIQKEEEIRQDLGRPKYRKLSSRKKISRKKYYFARNYPEDQSKLLNTFNISNQVSFLKDNVIDLEKKMRRHSSVFNQYLDWFNETPSIWPVYGYIRSGFGWRTHPLKRKRQFHKGIDIPAWVGAPVQATADGYVEFSGWGGGYGWMVVISHKFGIRTFYAHLSELEVQQGIRVNKGQIIGKIGTSGLSTGPHVHYEIRQRRKALEPTVYLNLDLFTAVSKLW